MDKKALTEQEIRTRFITPAIRQAHWPPHEIREKATTVGEDAHSADDLG